MLGGFIANYYLYNIDGIIFSLIGVMTAFLLMLPFFSLRLLGGGDVKLIMAIGAIMGMKIVVLTTVYSVISGSVMSIVFLAYKRELLGVIKGVCWTVYTLFSPNYSFEPLKTSPGLKMPFAFIIGIGGLIAINFNFLECLIE